MLTPRTANPFKRHRRQRLAGRSWKNDKNETFAHLLLLSGLGGGGELLLQVSSRRLQLSHVVLLILQAWKEGEVIVKTEGEDAAQRDESERPCVLPLRHSGRLSSFQVPAGGTPAPPCC